MNESGIRSKAPPAGKGWPRFPSGRPRAGGTHTIGAASARARLLRVIGKSKALEMVLMGERIDSKEAYRIGLVNKVVRSDELKTTVMATAHKMADASPISLEYTKEAIDKGMDLTLEQGLRLEADLYYLIHTTSDREEGIRAFQEKRKVQFEGE